MPTGQPGKLNIAKDYGRGNWQRISFALNRYCIETSRVLPTCLQPVSTSQLTFRALCEFLTAVSMKTTIFWNVTPCSLIQTHWHLLQTAASVSSIGELRPSRKKRQQIPPKRLID